ncbi:MAG: hypothetical protein JWM68_735 [Verrucomicrobiales bacterium]|nr:hypothetical protein [Verrucomicrobiales bacterium]
MKTRQTLDTRFARETRFEVRPLTAAVPFRAAQETQLERLKDRLLRRQLDNAPDAELNAPIRRAANEAAAIAWTTQFPLLLLPELFEEKTRDARRQFEKQTQIRVRTHNLFAEAA